MHQLPENIPTEIIQTLTADQAWHYKLLPAGEENGQLRFYTASSTPEEQVDELTVLFGKEVAFIQVADEALNKALATYYRKSKVQQSGVLSLNKSDDFLMALIQEAHQIDCSDIHIEAYEERCRVRMRIDGKLIERFTIPRSKYPGLINKIKIKANLDIAEKRLPQDGRIVYTDEYAQFDIRVSVLPALHGEKVVLRLLNRDATHIDIASLGFTTQQLQRYLRATQKTNGIILISGPTGSGKTTTLYATLKLLNKEESNILTIEDPIEYTLEGINQVQLKEDIGLSFATALRTFLRQDPDIIMLGEIRDAETAKMAIRAALTGHLVLSTIHTNSALGTISRLQDMGLAPYLVAGTLNLSVAQRLARKLCPNCRTRESLTQGDLPPGFQVDNMPDYHYKANGCEACYYTGYKGRKALYEIVELNDEIRDYVRHGRIDELRNDFQVKSLADVAFEMVRQGETSLEEVYSLLL
jgi:general secretion pathway protein E/type IV pilus assembly protein PilB